MLKKLIPANAESILQEAVHAELYISNLYLHLSNQCQRKGLFGAAKYFRAESDDERGHYQKIADFLNDRGSVAELPEIDACTEEVDGLKSAVEIAYQAELDLGDKYERWYKSASPITQQFLLQYLEIQRRSIGEYGDLLSRLELAGADECAILIIDKEIGDENV